jgi:hypothetical protein
MIAATAMAAAPSPASHTCASVGGVRRAVFFVIDNNLNNDVYSRLVRSPTHSFAQKLISHSFLKLLAESCKERIPKVVGAVWKFRMGVQNVH